MRQSSAIQWVAIQKAIKEWVVGGSGLAADHVIWEHLKGPRPSTPYIELEIHTVSPVSHDWVTKEPNPLVFTAKTVASVNATANTLTITGHELVTGDGPIRFAQVGGALPEPLLPDTDYWVVAMNANAIKVAETFDATGGNDPTFANPITTIDLTTAGSGTITLVKTTDTVRAGKELKRVVNGFRELTLDIEAFGVEGSGLQVMSMVSDVMTALPLYVDTLDAAGVGATDVGVVDVDGNVRSIDGRLGGVDEPRAQVEVALFVSAQLDTTHGRVDRVHVASTATFNNDSSEEVDSRWMPSPPP